MHSFYPDIEPYDEHLLNTKPLSTGQRHQIYVEECGNPRGLPVVFLHGGPGSGCRPQHRCYFDPNVYRIVLFDQRGCGRSLPAGELEDNNSQFLIDDIEMIRQILNIDKWVVFGGSWGATLGLLYAQQHADKVFGMILRGTFLGRDKDINWVYAAGGASQLFPDAWHQLVNTLPDSEQEKPLNAYFKLLTNEDPQQQNEAVKSLGNWESTIMTLRDHEYQTDPNNDPGPLTHSLIQLHFALNHCFIEDNTILTNIDKIRHIPTYIIHGRYDTVCPMQQSWELHQQWPEAKLNIVSMAGHAAGEPAIVDALVSATKSIAVKLT